MQKKLHYLIKPQTAFALLQPQKEVHHDYR